jgi:phenylacetate-coenzyme A ligase PaaK-like adenylate-forming protein
LLGLTVMSIYDTQSRHHSVPGIVELCCVEADTDKSDGARLRLARQSYDTEALQATVAGTLDKNLRHLRAGFAQTSEKRAIRHLMRLQELVGHAYDTVPFYSKLYRSAGFEPGDFRSLHDFSSLPVVTKADLLQAEPRDLQSGLDCGDVYFSRTSGSSGSPLTVAYSADQYVISMCNYLWQLELARGRPLDPDRWLYNLHHARWWLSSLSGKYRTFALADLPDERELRRHLGIIRPQAIIALTSLLAAIGTSGLELPEFGIEVATTNSEQSTRAERLRLASKLGVAVLDEYSSVELEQTAFECCHGRYHVLDHSVFLEIVRTDADGNGSIVGTNLHAKKMPFIRYDQGDVGAWSPSAPCSCGNTAPALDSIQGRRNASFVNSSGRLIPAASLMYVVDEFLADASSGVSQFQLHQTATDHLNLYFSPNDDGSAAVERLSMVQSHLERLFGHRLRIDFKRMDVQPGTKSKRQLLVSDLS